MTKKNICFIIGSRANYSSIKSVLSAVNKCNKFNLQIILCASALLERYGNVSKNITNDGFEITKKLYTIIEGETPLTMAKTTGLGLIELASVFDDIKCDIVFNSFYYRNTSSYSGFKGKRKRIFFSQL